MSKTSGNGPVEIIWDFFVSVKAAVVLLAIWLVGSVAGTLIPQNAQPAMYVELYGPTWANLMLRIGLFDVYHSTWYALILLLLMLSITACTMNTYSAKSALAFAQPKKKSITGSGKRYVTFSPVVGDAEAALDRLKAALQKHYKQVDDFERDGHRRLFAHKQPWAHFMVYIVHLSLVVIIVGGMVSALAGFEGRMSLQIGSAQSRVAVPKGGMMASAELPFTLRLDDFDFQRFEDGRPKDWVSKLSVVENGNDMLSKTIEVNDPLIYGNYNFYQTSWIERAVLHVSLPNGERRVTVKLGEGEETFIRDLNLAVAVQAYEPMQGGKTMLASVLFAQEDGQVWQTIATMDTERNDANQMNLPFRFNLDKAGSDFTSILQVVSDPGVGFIWAGCFLMVLGLYLTFYSSHRRVAVTALDGKLAVVGLAQRNVTAFRRELERILKAADISLDDDCRKDAS